MVKKEEEKEFALILEKKMFTMGYFKINLLNKRIYHDIIKKWKKEEVCKKKMFAVVYNFYLPCYKEKIAI